MNPVYPVSAYDHQISERVTHDKEIAERLRDLASRVEAGVPATAEEIRAFARMLSQPSLQNTDGFGPAVDWKGV